jgi:AAA family ATP:ADP antiporter
MDRETRIQVGGLSALCFVILCSYAIARPAAESMFLSAYTEDWLPRVWIAVAIASVAVVAIYNRVSAHRNLVWLFGMVSLVSAVLLAALLVAGEAGLPGVPFVLYVWKDVYIVLLVEIFWSFANSVVPRATARKIYGLFCVVGSLGGITGNLAVGALSVRFGTERSVVAVLPLLGLAWLGARWLSGRGMSSEERSQEEERTSLLEGFQVLKSSRFLVWMLLLIATTQLVINLIDYRYNAMLAAAYPDMDARTAMIGQIYAAIDMGSILLQLTTGLILAAIGVTGALFLVPCVLLAALLSHALLPGFVFMAVAKVASKSLDYSLFRAAKEMLYLPLSHREKTQGKALVDVMTYRVAKGAASLLLLLFVALDARGLALVAAFVGVGIWLVLTRALTRRYRELEADGEA